MRYLFLLIPIGLIAYVMMRIWNILPLNGLWKTIVTCLAIAILIGMFVSVAVGLEKLPLNMATIVYEICDSWLFILLYLLMIFLCMDLLRLVGIMPKEFLFSSWKGTLSVTALVFIIFLYGNIHYYNKYRKEINIETAKIDKPIKIVMMSDLHIGYHNRRSTLRKWVDMINKEDPDLVLIGGDIIDISTYPLMKERSYEEFHRLKAPIFACLGNHEYYASLEKTEQFYNLSKINLLRDSAAVFNNQLLIIGRDDRSVGKRQTINKLKENFDTNLYSIVLDHQPYNLEQSSENNIDFQFSGHTHDGQLFPINLITRAIYEKSFGEYHKQNTDYYITSGLGIWGGKFRIGTKSEYVVLNLRPKAKQKSVLIEERQRKD